MVTVSNFTFCTMYGTWRSISFPIRFEIELWEMGSSSSDPTFLSSSLSRTEVIWLTEPELSRTLFTVATRWVFSLSSIRFNPKNDVQPKITNQQHAVFKFIQWRSEIQHFKIRTFWRMDFQCPYYLKWRLKLGFQMVGAIDRVWQNLRTRFLEFDILL